MDGKLWTEARDALAGVAELSRLKGGEGLDIYCLNNPKYRLDVRVRSLPSFIVGETYPWKNDAEVHGFFNELVPEGWLLHATSFAILLLMPPQVKHPPATS